MLLDVSKLLNQQELANYFGVTVRAIVNWRDEGMPTAYARKGGPVFFDPGDVSRWLKERSGQGTRSRHDGTPRGLRNGK